MEKWIVCWLSALASTRVVREICIVKRPFGKSVNFVKMLRVAGARLVPQRSSVVLNRNYTTGGSSQSSAAQPSARTIPDVQGVSKKVVDVPEYAVGFAGSKKDSDYKNPEYFCYHVDSFADAMVEMEKYRLPAPSNKAKAK